MELVKFSGLMDDVVDFTHERWYYERFGGYEGFFLKWPVTDWEELEEKYFEGIQRDIEDMLDGQKDGWYFIYDTAYEGGCPDWGWMSADDAIKTLQDKIEKHQKQIASIEEIVNGVEYVATDGNVFAFKSQLDRHEKECAEREQYMLWAKSGKNLSDEAYEVLKKMAKAYGWDKMYPRSLEQELRDIPGEVFNFDFIYQTQYKNYHGMQSIDELDEIIEKILDETRWIRTDEQRADEKKRYLTGARIYDVKNDKIIKFVEEKEVKVSYRLSEED